MTNDEIDTDSSDDSGSSRAGARWTRAVAFTVIGVTVTHLAALAGNQGPVLYSDALGYLGNARFLAGGTPPTFDGSFAYSPGYSMLLTPLYWFTQNSDIIWTTSVLLNVALATLIMAPAYRLARRMFDLDRYPSLLAAAMVSLTPALLLQPGRIWTETLFPLVFLLSVAAVASLFATNKFNRRAVLSAGATGLLVGYLISIHGRGIAAAGALITVLLLGVAVRRLHAGAALLAAAAMGIVFAADLAVRSYLTDQLWMAGTTPTNGGSVARILGAYAPENLVSTLSTGLGHAWYVVVVSFGLAIVGVVALVLVVAGSPRWHPANSSVQAGALFAVLAVVGVAFLSAGLLSNVNRVDHRVYGRYLEGVTPILTLAGGASLLKVPTAWRTFAYGAASILPAGLVLYWLRGPDQFIGNVQKFTVPGLLGMQSIVAPSTAVFLDQLNIVAISTLATVIGIAAAFAVRRQRTIGVVAVLAFTVGITFLGKATSWDPFVSFWHDAYDDVPSALREVPNGQPIMYDLTFLNPDARNLYEFRIAPRRLTFVTDVCQAARGSVVISATDQHVAGIEGTQLASDPVPEQALWLVTEEAAGPCD